MTSRITKKLRGRPADDRDKSEALDFFLFFNAGRQAFRHPLPTSNVLSEFSNLCGHINTGIVKDSNKETRP